MRVATSMLAMSACVAFAGVEFRVVEQVCNPWEGFPSSSL